MSCFDRQEVVPWALRGTCNAVKILADWEARSYSVSWDRTFNL